MILKISILFRSIIICPETHLVHQIYELNLCSWERSTDSTFLYFKFEESLVLWCKCGLNINTELVTTSDDGRSPLFTLTTVEDATTVNCLLPFVVTLLQ